VPDRPDEPKAGDDVLRALRKFRAEHEPSRHELTEDELAALAASEEKLRRRLLGASAWFGNRLDLPKSLRGLVIEPVPVEPLGPREVVVEDRRPKSHVHIGRGYVSLKKTAVKNAKGLLLKRANEQKLRGRDRLPVELELSYDAIARRVGLNRDRVTQIRDLMAEGWDVSRESHPDFRAKRGQVNLPTVAELRRLRRSRRIRD
jgi:hypothetical protein